MKKLAVVSSSFFPFTGGQEIGLENLLKGLRQSVDCEIDVVTPRYDRHTAGEESWRGLRVTRYPTTLIRYPTARMAHEFNLAVHMAYALVWIPRILRRLRPDRVLAYFLAPTAAAAIRFARAQGVPSALFLGGSDIYQHRWPLGRATRFAMQHADRVMASSCFVRDCARMGFRVPDKPVDLIPFPIDLAAFPEQPKASRGPLRLLCVQRLVPSKGTQLLIHALRKLVDQGFDAPLLDIVGDGPQRPELETLVDALDLRARVVFHGEQPHDQVVGFFQRSRVFCFPTLSEGFGIVLLEAMATGNIVVASRCTAIPEIVRHEQTGLLFEAGSVESLTSTLAPVLRQPEQFRDLAAAARTAAQAFDMRVIGRRLADVLEAAGER